MQRIWKVDIVFDETMNILNFWGDVAKILPIEYSTEKISESN